jgi:glucose-6-phosphate isomerase
MGVAARGYRELAGYMACRYDISVFGHGALGEEWFKTSGHYHPPILEAPTVSYPEVYEVIRGKCLFLLQSLGNAADVLKPPQAAPVEDVILLEVHEGERAVMPPNYGHVMINHVPDSVVVTSNWVSSRFTSLYGPYEMCHGGAYYVLREGDGLKLEANPRYGKLPQTVTYGRPRQDLPELGIKPGTPLYTSFYRWPDRWQYVARPDLRREQLQWDAVIEAIQELTPGEVYHLDC